MSELFDKIFGSFPEMRLMKEELMAKHTRESGVYKRMSSCR